MATATAFTADRSKAIEDQAVTGGSVDASGNLTLVRNNGTTIAAGNIKGPKGDPGDNVDAKAYSDSGDAATLASAKTYADGTGATALTDAKAYFDGHKMIKGLVMGDGANLNTFVTNGIWTQGTNASAATGSNYPRALAGVLEVRTNAEGTGIFVYQRYTVYGSYNPLTYQRTLYNGTWSTWAAVSVMDEEFTPTGASNFNYLGGKIRMVTLPSLKRLAFLHFTLQRQVSNYGTLPNTSWTNIGSVIPSGARFTPAYTTYLNGWVTTGSNTLPISVYIDYSGGGMSFKGMMGSTTTINLNDIITINATMVES